MSKSELNKTQSDLKIAIQTHQILVSKMQVQPLDLGLKSQLHSLQKDILALNQKQKQIVQKLKMELIERTTGVENADPQVSLTSRTEDPGSSETQKCPLPSAAPPSLANTPSPTTLRVPTYQAGSNNRLEHLLSDTASHRVLGSVSSNQSKSSGVSLKSRSIYSSPKHLRERAHMNNKLTLNPDVSMEKAQEFKQKLDFMASIDLVPPDSVSDAVGKRSERKRKSTNNPNFAYGLELERRSKLSNFIASDYFGAKKPKGVYPVQKSDSSSSDTPPSSPVSSPSAVQQKGSPRDQGENCCHACSEGGQLLVCEGCSLSFHEECVLPPPACLPESRLKCGQCQEAAFRTSQSLTAVSKYIEARRAKEEEKRKLLKRNVELLHEKMHLENCTTQLNDILSRHGIKKQELLDINLKAKQSVENLKHFVKSVQSS